jgi:hypothetical protein
VERAPDVEAAGWLRTLWLYIWVVPRAQWDLFDVDYQVYIFRIFHRELRTRIIHYITIPAIMFFSLAFLVRFPLWPGAPRWCTAATAYAGVTALLHLPWCWKQRVPGLWLATAAELALFWIVATLMPVPHPILGMYVFALAETVAHALEPVPPYTTGAGRWMSNAEFRRGPLGSKILAGLATPTVFTLVSFLSNPRSIPMPILRISSRLFGYQRQLVGRIDEVAAREWRSGQPHMHSVPQH